MRIFKIYIVTLIAFAACLLPSDLSKPSEIGLVGVAGASKVTKLEDSSHAPKETLAIVPITPIQHIQFAAKDYGWDTGSEWASLHKLLGNESGINPYAVNKKSGACGMFQAWPCEKMGVPLSDVAGQARWGVSYIKNRYGSPSKALAFWYSQCGSPQGCWY